MAILAAGDLLIGDVLLSARAAALSPRYALVATDPTRLLKERMQAAQSAEAMAVALAQPHRLGSASKRAGDALEAFCRRMRLRSECYRAGQDYDMQVRAEKAARGFYVAGDQPAPPDGLPELTEAQKQAKRELAIMTLEKTNAVLAEVHQRCPRRMQALCLDRVVPSPYDEAMLVHGLLSLARHFGLLDEGINRGKVA